MKLGVNIDHVATLRQARGTPYPSLPEAVAEAEAGGADGITIHLREDRRHIQDHDLFEIRQAVRVPLNLEMANDPGVLELALRARPDEACLVPERRQELTTEGGLDAAGQYDRLAPTVAALLRAGVRVSLFIEPVPEQIDAARRLGAPMIELHTGRYANLDGAARDAELARLADAAEAAHDAGLQVNAGHGLHYSNLPCICFISYPFSFL